MPRNCFWIRFVTALALAIGCTHAAVADPVDLSSWTVESAAIVPAFPDANWLVFGTGNYAVEQRFNSQPSFFVSNSTFFNDEVRFNFVATNADDDFVGFAVGYQPGDATNTTASYLLVDWKGASQNFNFHGEVPSTPGGTGQVGLAVSWVTGAPTADEFWSHSDFGANANGGVSEIARGINFGNSGWTPGAEYEMRILYTDSSLQVFVNDVLEIDLVGAFESGNFALYNFSQPRALYYDVEFGPGGSGNEVPEPASLALWGAVVGGGIYWLRRRRR